MKVAVQALKLTSELKLNKIDIEDDALNVIGVFSHIIDKNDPLYLFFFN